MLGTLAMLAMTSVIGSLTANPSSLASQVADAKANPDPAAQVFTRSFHIPIEGAKSVNVGFTVTETDATPAAEQNEEPLLLQLANAIHTATKEGAAAFTFYIDADGKLLAATVNAQLLG